MAKSDVEKYPTIVEMFEDFLSQEGKDALDEDWEALPVFEGPDGHKLRPFEVQTTDGLKARICLSDKVDEFYN